MPFTLQLVQKKCASYLHAGVYTSMHVLFLWKLKWFCLYQVGQMLEVENIYDSAGTTLLDTAVLSHQRFSWVIQEIERIYLSGACFLFIQLLTTVLPRQEYYIILSCIIAECIPHLRHDTIKYQSDYSYIGLLHASQNYLHDPYIISFFLHAISSTCKFFWY